MGKYINICLFDLGETIVDGIASFFYTILMWLNCIIYSLISYVYNIFLILAQGGAIFDTQRVEGLVRNVYVVIGVIVLFLIAYSLLKSLVNPDEALKGKKSPIKIIKDVIISIILIAFVPYIFDFAFTIQNSLLINNTIGKLIAGSTDKGNDNAETIRKGGYNMAAGIWRAFLQPADGYCATAEDEERAKSATDTGGSGNCKIIYLSDGTTYFEAWDKAYQDTTFWDLIGLNGPILKGEVNYIFIVDVVAGVYVLFVLMGYALGMATRLIKLAFFELLAPLPILMRILPNDQSNKVFSNWLKAVISTFAEVFIRVAILYFAVIIISTVGASLDDIFANGSFSAGQTLPFTKSIAFVLIILGIIAFIKQAPDLIKEITGLDSKKHSKGLLTGLGMMAAGIGGGITASIRSYNADKSNPELAGKSNLLKRRALTAGLSAGARGLFEGSKVSKFGDITKQAGKAASGSLASRAKIEAAGGLKGYLNQQLDDSKARFQDWKGGSAEAIKAEKAASDKLLQIVSNVKATAEDYIDKHASEYNGNLDILLEKGLLSNTESSVYKDLIAALQEAKTSGNEEDIGAATKLLEDFKKQIGHDYRLDILKAKANDANISAEERARFGKAYDESRKNEVNIFATTVQDHTGAEKEKALVNEELKTLQEIIKENKSSLAVQNLLNGNKEYDLKAFVEEFSNANAGKYLKAVKDAADYANIAVQRQLNDIERRAEHHKATPNGGNGGKNS